MSRGANYPSQVTFITKIYHPGINEEGSICVPILRDQVGHLAHVNAQLDRRELLQWKPSITLATGENLRSRAPYAGYSCVSSIVLSVIQEKVNNPSADDPFEPEIAAVSTPARWENDPGRTGYLTPAIKE